jgi:menaquinone-dependent protoporphyrinogen oxidase
MSGGDVMKVLVAYATHSGSTAEIAERVAQRLHAAGHHPDLGPVTTFSAMPTHDAFVIGSAVYLGRWQKEALTFVERNRPVLATGPTWLFSSGPLGAERTDTDGRDIRVGALLAGQIDALIEAVQPRDHRVFFGALDPDRIGLGPRLMRLTPAGRKLLQEGDFRDWAEIEAWADSIARELSAGKVPADTKA